MKVYPKSIDKRPTLAEWPVRIWNISEFPLPFKNRALAWMDGNFEKYSFVYAPARPSLPSSCSYLFGYGEERIILLQEQLDDAAAIALNRKQIVTIHTSRELLNAVLTVEYMENGTKKTFSLPYVPSVYYLYDPFLDWMLGLEKDFSFVQAEQKYPRPQKLYGESLAMYNLSLSAYRLGDSFSEYSYSSQIRRNRFMPWKKDLEEWLEIPMDRGIFRLHSFKYLTECSYQLHN